MVDIQQLILNFYKNYEYGAVFIKTVSEECSEFKITPISINHGKIIFYENGVYINNISKDNKGFNKHLFIPYGNTSFLFIEDYYL